MDEPDGCPERRPEVDQRARREDGNRAAAVPRLGGPIELHDLARVEGLVPEVVGEVLQRGGAALVVGPVLPHARLVTADEAHHDPEAAVGRRRVEGDLDRTDLADGLPGEALGTPDWRRVDRPELYARPLRQVLHEVVAEGGEGRLEVDASRERRG